ncbi:uncharacterized protein LOC110461252 [Mizuhopecten yessoensis]|uniref:uncharacterized protein LOC110461252 n=1 Tax=Mizuhopecten yessoensis TaxID=6573 RepID=UPI000B4586EC|nr:uncharacterized protein LOC110461252 [Mizuhopecten yessoensis]
MTGPGLVVDGMISSHKSVGSGLHIVRTNGSSVLVAGYVHGWIQAKAFSYPLVINSSLVEGTDALLQECETIRPTAALTRTIQSTAAPTGAIRPTASFVESTKPTLVLTDNSTSSCSCNSCGNYSFSNYTTEELHAVIEQLRAELLVQRNSTSSYIRTKISAKDNRPSSTAIGCVGCMILVIAGLGILAMDAGVLVEVIKNIKRNVCPV